MKEEIYARLEKSEREKYAKAKEQNDKAAKFEALANIIDYTENGNRARQLVNIVAKEYAQKPQELTNFFSDRETGMNLEGEFIDSIVDGIARSAYVILTQDFDVIKDSRYGGFGITLNTSPKKLETTDKQFKYAKLKGDALQNSINKEYALHFSVNFDSSLKESRNYDKALYMSINFDNSLKNSKNSGNSLFYSVNSDNALSNSINKDRTLANAINFDSSLKGSKNYDRALTTSHNVENSLNNTKNYGDALNLSKNRDNALRNSRNYGNTLMCSKNFDNAGMYSRNGPKVGKMAKTHENAFTKASMKKNSFLFSKHYGDFKGGKFSFNNLNKAYQLVKNRQQERLIYFARLN